jgi:hypothetical protein
MDAGGGGQLFSIDPLEHQDAWGDDVFTSMAAGSNVIVLDTSRGWLVRHDYTLEDAHSMSPPPPFAPSPSARAWGDVVSPPQLSSSSCRSRP